MLRTLCLVVVLPMALACSSASPQPITEPVDDGDPPSPPPDAPPPTEEPTTVELSILTYNVAGLPEGVSGSSPATNIPQISPLLDGYELVLVQEDFSYHGELEADASHPYRSEPMETELSETLGDGLNRFSISPFAQHQRHEWEECNGLIDSANDCLTPKGFTVATHDFDGTAVDVYNMHMDAGRGSKDRDAREAQLAQLVRWIDEHSSDRPIIIGGDTNLKDDEDEAILVSFMEQAGMIDACRFLDCLEPRRIDRVFVRSSDKVELTPRSWSLAEEFVDDAGEPLSDHEAVHVALELTVYP